MKIKVIMYSQIKRPKEVRKIPVRALGLSTGKFVKVTRRRKIEVTYVD